MYFDFKSNDDFAEKPNRWPKPVIIVLVANRSALMWCVSHVFVIDHLGKWVFFLQQEFGLYGDIFVNVLNTFIFWILKLVCRHSHHIKMGYYRNCESEFDYFFLVNAGKFYLNIFSFSANTSAIHLRWLLNLFFPTFLNNFKKKKIIYYFHLNFSFIEFNLDRFCYFAIIISKWIENIIFGAISGTQPLDVYTKFCQRAGEPRPRSDINRKCTNFKL